VDSFKPSIYRILPLFNSFMQVIRTFEKRNNALNVTVLDSAGILSGKIDSLLDFARHITVLTDNIHDYKTASQRVMDSCGAAIVINDYDYPEVSDSVVFCDEYDDRLKNCPVVFCADENAASEKIINGYELEAEDFVLEKKPESIDLFDFAAALYELNDLKRAGEFAFSKLKIADKEVSIEEMKKMIKNAIDFK
ncbi:MAG: hypothetical protein IJS17_01635, partial [Clostridia bacterium]|nr:hypothetical protein [Clostridia bacterium]